MESGKLRGEWIDPALGKVTFGEWAERWFESTAALKPHTRAGYRTLLRSQILPAFEGKPLAAIQPIDVSEWIAGLSNGLGASRVRQSFYLLGEIVNAAVQSGYIAKTPCVGVRLPKPVRREMRFLGAADVERLADASWAPTRPSCGSWPMAG